MSVFEEEEIKRQLSHLIIQLMEQKVQKSGWKGARNFFLIDNYRVASPLTSCNWFVTCAED